MPSEMFIDDKCLHWVRRYAPSALDGAVQPYALRKVLLADMTTEDFLHTHYLQHRPVLVRNSFGPAAAVDGTTTSAIAALGALNDTDLFLHKDIAANEADITSQDPGDVMRASEYLSTTCADVCEILTKRRHEQTGGNTEGAASSSSLYAKISTTHSPSLSGCVTGFLNTTQPLEPVVHPMLLRPGAYFSWAFIGEALSGSKTHVDVMGSDAWLVVLQGRKLWALCHPLDKHLIMHEETGEFANMLNIDAVRFPRAKFARITYFVQQSGDAIFVPGDAPHTVINLEFSTSITFNFMYAKAALTWKRMMQRVVDEDSADGNLDIILYRHVDEEVNAAANAWQQTSTVEPSKASPSPPAVTRLTVRLQLPARCFHDGVLSSEYGTRVYLGDVYTAMQEQHGQLFRADGLKCVGWPKGFDVQPLCTSGGPNEGHRVVLSYVVDDETMAVLVSRCCLQVESHGTLRFLSTVYNVIVDDDLESPSFVPQPQHPCSLFASHVGRIPSLPPLSVLLQQSWPCDANWNYRTLLSVVQERRKRAAAAAATAAIATEEQPLSSLHDTVAPMSTWHYSRFPWSVADGHRSWSCLTYLFYSSPYVVGPVNLYPMLDDRTLQSLSALSAVESSAAAGSALSRAADVPQRFDPHFEEFNWNVKELLQPCSSAEDDAPVLCLLDLGDDLMAELCKKMLLAPWSADFFDFCRRHTTLFGSVASVDWATIGLEKLAILALYFSCRPGLVGFTYNFTFRNVTEPFTICLSGSAADQLLARRAPSSLSALATSVCSFVEGFRGETSADVDVSIEAIVEELSAAEGGVSAQSNLDWVLNIIRVKQRDVESLLASSEEVQDADEQLKCEGKLHRSSMLESRLRLLVMPN